MKDLLPLIPITLHETIKASQYYAKRSDSLVIQSDSSRKQGENVEACYTKLQDLIRVAGNNIRGETSPEQAAKVRRLLVAFTDLLSSNIDWLLYIQTENQQ